MNKKTLFDLGWTINAKIVAMFFFFASDIVVARFLSVNEYGEWSYCFSILSICYWIGQFGVNSSAKVYAAQNVNKKQELLNVINASQILRILISVITTIGYIIFVTAFVGKLGYPAKYPHLLKLLYGCSFLLFFNSYSEYYKEMNIGIQKYKNLFIVTSLEYIGYFIFTFLSFFVFGNDEFSVVIGYIAAYVVENLVGNVLLRKTKSEIRADEIHADVDGVKRYIKSIFVYALPILIMNIGGLILLEMDTFMIGTFSAGTEVAIYSVPKKICTKAVHISLALSTATIPKLVGEKSEESKSKFAKVCRINWVFAIGALFAIILFGEFAITLLYGKEYIACGSIFRILAVYFLLFSASTPYAMFLDYKGKANSKMVDYIIMILINLVLNFLLIPKYGARGAAIATSIAMIPYTIAMIVKAKKTFK